MCSSRLCVACAVYLNGGPITSEWTSANVPAILEAFYPGELGGDAIVNTLLGVNNPGLAVLALLSVPVVLSGWMCDTRRARFNLL